MIRLNKRFVIFGLIVATGEHIGHMRADITYDKDHDLYICPSGMVLKTSGRVHDGSTLCYWASKLDCEAYPPEAALQSQITWAPGP